MLVHWGPRSGDWETEALAPKSQLPPPSPCAQCGHKGLSHLPTLMSWLPHHLMPGEEVGEEMGSILWPQSLGVACLPAGKREFGEISAADVPDNAREAASTGHALACRNRTAPLPPPTTEPWVTPRPCLSECASVGGVPEHIGKTTGTPSIACIPQHPGQTTARASHTQTHPPHQAPTHRQ